MLVSASPRIECKFKPEISKKSQKIMKENSEKFESRMSEDLEKRRQKRRPKIIVVSYKINPILYHDSFGIFRHRWSGFSPDVG